jgi:hypothetical protein
VNIVSARVAVHLWVWAAVLRLLKQFVPLETLVRMVHREPARRQPSVSLTTHLEEYMVLDGRFPFRPPGNCLERSLGAYRLLCEANTRPELVIGLRRWTPGGVQGHVWVTVAGRPFAERNDQTAAYVPVVVFDSGARRHSSPASEDVPEGIA